ncbi:MAG: YceI family protein [Phycisphaerales bacterium]|nr:MAG: YceI family protein [Phycisphaerales bacterium]
MRVVASICSAILLFAVPVTAKVTYYDIGKNGENKINIAWESRAAIETMVGRTVEAHGLVRWDAENPAESGIEVSVPVRSIKTGIELRDQHMYSGDWLDAERYPEVGFKTTRVEPVKDKDNAWVLHGVFSCHGVDQQMKIEAEVKELPARPDLENYGYVGDIVHVTAKFDVNVAEHGVQIPKNLAAKVAETVTCTVDIFGFTNNKPHRDK